MRWLCIFYFPCLPHSRTGRRNSVAIAFRNPSAALSWLSVGTGFEWTVGKPARHTLIRSVHCSAANAGAGKGISGRDRLGQGTGGSSRSQKKAGGIKAGDCNRGAGTGDVHADGVHVLATEHVLIYTALWSPAFLFWTASTIIFGAVVRSDHVLFAVQFSSVELGLGLGFQIVGANFRTDDRATPIIDDTTCLATTDTGSDGENADQGTVAENACQHWQIPELHWQTGHRAPWQVPGCAPFVPLAHVAQGEHADATQQNPSVQNPDVHCAPEEHAMPFGIFALQTFVAQ